MANTKSAAKRARQMAGRTLRNRSVLTRLRGMQKRSGSAAQPDAKEIGEFISAIDKAAKRGIIHKNTARRRKARLNKRMRTVSQKPA
ncbi:MAG: 30S ribosomal protein S20 [Verrucomicrobiota bacterium]